MHSNRFEKNRKKSPFTKRILVDPAVNENPHICALKFRIWFINLVRNCSFSDTVMINEYRNRTNVLSTHRISIHFISNEIVYKTDWKTFNFCVTSFFCLGWCWLITVKGISTFDITLDKLNQSMWEKEKSNEKLH